jgi:hypothetical protein
LRRHVLRKQLASARTHTCLTWHIAYDLKASAELSEDALHTLLNSFSKPVYHQ